MNPIQKESIKIEVPVFPKSLTHTARHKHPLFWWNNQHMRSVTVKPVMSDKIFTSIYTATGTDTIFIDKQAAEHYLGKNIPEPEYEHQIYAEKLRNVFAHYLCPDCGHVGCSKIDVFFQGPFNMVTHLTKTTADLPCPKCDHTIPVDINVEPCPDSSSSEDCDWK